MKIKIDVNGCDHCGTCISVCPCDALLLTNTLSVDDNKCSRCGTCCRICPIGALQLSSRPVKVRFV